MSITPAFEIGLWNAWIFMICFLLPPIISILVDKGKASSKRLNVSVPIKHEKLFNVISTAILVAGIIYSIFLPLQLGKVWFFIGLVIFLIAFVISISATFFVRTTPTDKPFTKGPYRYSRHPYYVAQTLILLSIAIASASWVFLMLTVIMGIFHLIFAPAEEQYCLKRYGKDYEEYMKRTPRWIGIPKSEESD
ncbi:MAG: isoprenylcysteine carboxylmethyltransferase family protein [Candidatus Methanomarinus sp.]|uniref:Isoprenylcysteine carboxylmethyltransferase family protein n=1 Tax=Candidatus Methanomarinus sp. TaxID=3386244 RepID=A0AC61SD27_9EURY|nr:MAG: isoprenylcysteine carboxylmethyltransferase family protein [ANME-2 cluster archaeon]